MTIAQTFHAHPIVLRFKGMFPHQIAAYERHCKRDGADEEHIDKSRTFANRLLIGSEDWASETLAEVTAMRTFNFAEEIEGLQQRNRQKDILRRMAESPKDPWRSTRHGPMREVILTAHKDWFAVPVLVGGKIQPLAREQWFEVLAVQWLKNTFGNDVVHAGADVDEQAYHVHAIILPRTVKRTISKSGHETVRHLLQPSKHAVIRSYEDAQTDVGAWFAQIGLTRGERTAQGSAFGPIEIRHPVRFP